MQAFLRTEKRIQDTIGKINYILLTIGIVILAVVVRIFLFNYESFDYMDFLSPWYDFIKSNGGFAALKYEFSNYSPAYLYLLAICTYLPIPKLYAIKMISILFDFLAAYFVYMIVREKFRNSKLIPLSASFVMLFAPTVIMNGAMWAQCDIIFTCWLLASILYLIRKDYFKAFIFYSIAFSFKLQAIFLLPLFVILYFKRRFSILNFLMIPGMYILLSVPCLIAGRPLSEILLIYVFQTTTYEHLTLNAPNLYQWIPIYDIETNIAAVAFAMAVVLMFCFICYKCLKDTDSSTIIKLSTVLLLLVPYVLPKMHERYFFPADILSIIYAFYFPKYFYLPVVVVLVSYFSYYPYLFPDSPYINLGHLAFALLVIIAIVGRDLYNTCFIKNVCDES